MQLVYFFCASPGLWEGSSQSTCANGRRHIMYHRAAKHTALCKSKRERQGATAGDSITFKRLLEVQQCTAVVAQKNSYHVGFDGKSYCVCTHSTHLVAKRQYKWRKLDTTWELDGQHMGTTCHNFDITCHHLEIATLRQHLGISDYWRSVPLPRGQHMAFLNKKSQLSTFFTFPFSFISFSILLSE